MQAVGKESGEGERERWRFSHVGGIESRKPFKINLRPENEIRKNQNVMGNIRPPLERTHPEEQTLN